jgi:hypothetical protein
LGVAGGVIARCALLEHAKLVRAVLRRDVHLRDDTRPPFLLRLTSEIDDLHGIAPFLLAAVPDRSIADTLKSVQHARGQQSATFPNRTSRGI